MGWYRLQRKGANPYPDDQPIKTFVRKISTNGVVAGIDMNVGQVAVALSTNKTILYEQPKTSLLETRIKRNQRAMARKKKGSGHQQKLRQRHIWLMRKKAARRNNWHHHVAKQISQKASTVVVEKLHTRGMNKSAKETVAEPGKNVKAKRGLNRVILNIGWSGLVQMLAYKCCEVRAVNPAYTSQTCLACQEVASKSRQGRSYKCVDCGHTDHADFNAARNILASGIRATARLGALALATPLTRESAR